MNLVHDYLVCSARRWPAKPAVVCGTRTLTFDELNTFSDHLSVALQESGVTRGDRVVLFAENSTELAIGLWATLKAGGVFVIVNPTAKSHKLHYILNDCGARAILAQPSLAQTLEAALHDVTSVRAVIWTDTPTEAGDAGRTLTEVTDRARTRPAASGLIDHDLCALVYTSGSTGDPKGVMLTHRNMTNTAWAVSTYLGNTPDDTVLCVLPLSFDYGLYQLITGARVGFTVVLERSFAYPYRVLQRIEQHRVTGVPGVPTIFATLLRMAPFDRLDLSSIRYLTNTGAALPPAHIRRLQHLFPQALIYSMYGLTECTRVSYLHPSRLTDKCTSVGKAMPNCETYIVDDAGQRVGPGVVGELVVRGANVMRGYWCKPDETGRCLRPGDIAGEQVLYTGDLFQTDDEGFLYFVGRRDDIFKCKGEKISPKEVENVLYGMDSIAEAAVIGVDDAVDGQAVKALVVPRHGIKVTEQAVRRHCRNQLESFMVPKFVEICDKLPKTATGKIRRGGLA